MQRFREVKELIKNKYLAFGLFVALFLDRSLLLSLSMTLHSTSEIQCSVGVQYRAHKIAGKIIRHVIVVFAIVFIAGYKVFDLRNMLYRSLPRDSTLSL